MAMNFPSSPTEGQTYAAPGGPTYTFTGGLWTLPSGGGGSEIEVGDTPPASPQPNSLWWESDTGYLFLYYDDGNTEQFVQVNGTVADPHAGNAWQIRLNPVAINESVTVPAGFNGMTAGPVTIADGVTVSVADGSTWTVI